MLMIRMARFGGLARGYGCGGAREESDRGGYHGTSTGMWIRLVDGVLRELGEMERAAFAALAVERFAEQRDIFRQYYDFDVVKSTEARLRWVEPNLGVLD